MSRGKEGLFQDKIIKWLNEISFVVKFNANALTKSGVPDILCCYKGNFVAIEVKAPDGKRSELQQYNINTIRNNGGLAYCIKPSDWEQFKELLISQKWKELEVLSKQNEKEIEKI